MQYHDIGTSNAECGFSFVLSFWLGGNLRQCKVSLLSLRQSPMSFIVSYLKTKVELHLVALVGVGILFGMRLNISGCQVCSCLRKAPRHGWTNSIQCVINLIPSLWFCAPAALIFLRASWWRPFLLTAAAFNHFDAFKVFVQMILQISRQHLESGFLKLDLLTESCSWSFRMWSSNVPWSIAWPCFRSSQFKSSNLLINFSFTCWVFGRPSFSLTSGRASGGINET